MADDENKNGGGDSETQTLLGAAYNSYQNNAPAVQQLDDVIQHPQRHAWYGDATLEPNTGQTNSYDYALFGLALHEILDRLRLSIIVSSLLVFVITFFTWWQHLFKPFQLILSLVVGALVLILLIVEVSSMFNAPITVGASSTATAATGSGEDVRSYQDKFNQFLQATNKYGLLVLHHPIGKTVYMFVCGFLCFWVGGVSYILGLLFLLNAAVLLYCWLTYPEFRSLFETNDENAPTDRSPISAPWSAFRDQVSEKASRLSSSFQKES